MIFSDEKRDDGDAFPDWLEWFEVVANFARWNDNAILVLPVLEVQHTHSTGYAHLNSKPATLF